eukprot:1161269-Pelagomonas_calceolata.AAC.13
MQCMLDRLRGYAARKGLTVIVAKSEVVHFNSGAGSQLPTFRYGKDQLADTDSFTYIYKGMHSTRSDNMVAAAERVVPTFHAGCLCMRHFASDIGRKRRHIGCAVSLPHQRVRGKPCISLSEGQREASVGLVGFWKHAAPVHQSYDEYF